MVIHIVCAESPDGYHSLILATVDSKEAATKAEEFNVDHYACCDIRYHVHYGIPLKGAMKKFRQLQGIQHLQKELLT